MEDNKRRSRSTFLRIPADARCNGSCLLLALLPQLAVHIKGEGAGAEVDLHRLVQAAPGRIGFRVQDLGRKDGAIAESDLRTTQNESHGAQVVSSAGADFIRMRQKVRCCAVSAIVRHPYRHRKQ